MGSDRDYSVGVVADVLASVAVLAFSIFLLVWESQYALLPS